MDYFLRRLYHRKRPDRLSQPGMVVHRLHATLHHRSHYCDRVGYQFGIWCCGMSLINSF